MYYEGNNELYHHGILGQKWGVRRYQNSDGTLTSEGKLRAYKKTDEYESKVNAKTRSMEDDSFRAKRKESAITSAVMGGAIGGILWGLPSGIFSAALSGCDAYLRSNVNLRKQAAAMVESEYLTSLTDLEDKK